MKIIKKRESCNDNINEDLDYKNLHLKNYILDNGKRIIPARITGITKIKQNKIAKSIKIARFLALLPYCDRHKKNII